MLCIQIRIISFMPYSVVWYSCSILSFLKAHSFLCIHDMFYTMVVSVVQNQVTHWKIWQCSQTKSNIAFPCRSAAHLHFPTSLGLANYVPRGLYLQYFCWITHGLKLIKMYMFASDSSGCKRVILAPSSQHFKSNPVFKSSVATGSVQNSIWLVASG